MQDSNLKTLNKTSRDLIATECKNTDKKYVSKIMSTSFQICYFPE